MNKLLNYKGLYGDNREPFFSHIPHHEILVTRSQLYDWSINEHIHNDLCQIFIFTQGDGTLLSEHHSIPLETPCIVFVPNNTLHGFTFQPTIEGDVFTLSERLFKEILEKIPTILLKAYTLQQYSFKENKPLFDTILLLKDQLISELKNTWAEKTTTTQLYLQLLFIHIYRQHVKTDNLVATPDHKALILYQTFCKLIYDYRDEYKMVKEYAGLMGITALHLNRICKMVAQKTALEVIHTCKIEEAKKHLRNKEYTIAEISYKIGITDVSYFSRLFKQQTGKSPTAYRVSKSVEGKD